MSSSARAYSGPSNHPLLVGRSIAHPPHPPLNVWQLRKQPTCNAPRRGCLTADTRAPIPMAMAVVVCG